MYLNKSILLLIGSLVFISHFGNAQDESKSKVNTDFSGNFKGDFRYFPDDALYHGQHQSYFSAYFQPEFYMDWKGGKQLIQFTGFLRLDQFDDESTHADIRELYWKLIKNKWEFSVGFKKVFWGVTESNQPVDIINQLDGYEGFDIEQKLGQAMVHSSWANKWGVIDVFAMSLFRQLRFPGIEGRPRPPSQIDYNKTEFESSMNEYNLDLAVRWSHSFSVFDVGLSHFYGSSRDPLFVSDNDIVFHAYYELINQTGLELQASTGSMLWKAEGIYRVSKRKTITAFTVGGEYTFTNIFRTGADIGLIAEYNYDNRGIELITALDDDFFFGLRLAVNDRQSTNLIGGLIIDQNNQSMRYSVKADRRIGNSWKIFFEISALTNIAESEFIYLIRNDSYGKIAIAKYF